MLYQMVNKHTGDRSEAMTATQIEKEMVIMGTTPEQRAIVLEDGWWVESRHHWWKPLWLPSRQPRRPK